jgi:hypothetical protein
MKYLLFMCLICLLSIVTLSFKNVSSAQKQTSDCGCVINALADVQRLKTDSTRKDLMERFTTEGGLSMPKMRTFVYQKCPYIKIDVTFDLVDKSIKADRLPREDPADKIIAISRPYLEYGVID